MKTNVSVFLSYSREDQRFRRELEKHLTLLKRQGIITSWHAEDISAGAEWEGEIDTYLNTADIILLLVSSDFMASKYCYSKEMMRAMERHGAEDALVIPIMLRATYYKGSPFDKLQ